MDVEDATGLTPRQKQLLRKSWEGDDGIAKQWKINGPIFYMELMNVSSEIKGHFKSFTGLSDDEIKKSPKLISHAVNFRLSVTSFLQMLDEPEVLVDLIEKVANNHYRRGIKNPELFTDAFKLFADFIQRKHTMDEDTQVAWVKACKVINHIAGEKMRRNDTELAQGDGLQKVSA